MGKKLIMILFCILILTGCKKDNELLVESYKVTSKIFETLTSGTEQGVYGIYYSNQFFVIYRGLYKGVESMAYTIEDNVLTIAFETVEIEQAKDYAFEVKQSSDYDTILVVVDGEDESFKTIYGTD